MRATKGPSRSGDRRSQGKTPAGRRRYTESRAEFDCGVRNLLQSQRRSRVAQEAWAESGEHGDRPGVVGYFGVSSVQNFRGVYGRSHRAQVCQLRASLSGAGQHSGDAAARGENFWGTWGIGCETQTPEQQKHESEESAQKKQSALLGTRKRKGQRLGARLRRRPKVDGAGLKTRRYNGIL
jgi:hypothetical protein